MILHSDGLLSKWGFNDGDVVSDVLADETLVALRGARGIPKRVLIDAVREFLLPALDQTVEVCEIATSHNPIRAEKVDGVDVTGFWYEVDAPLHLTPASVEVPDEWVQARARSLVPPSSRSE